MCRSFFFSRSLRLVSSSSFYHRALGLLLLRLVIGKDFPSFESIGNWARFNRMLQGDLDELKGRELPADLRVDLACELIQACLQEKPEDRQVLYITLFAEFVTFKFIAAGTLRRSCCIGCVFWRRGTPSW